MDFFFSGEIDHKVYKNFIKIEREVDRKLKKLKNKDYGDDLIEIAIIPVIQQEDFFKERKLYQRKAKTADYRLFIDFDQFLNGDYEVKKKLLIKNIIDSVRSLNKKAKNFDGLQLEQDILDLFQINVEQLEEL